ncbi:MAG: type I methionyl aminopeptidase [Actinomycetota bacterium]|nr:type I methionyl aminopeptidase [Actinomycetota bacterium]
MFRKKESIQIKTVDQLAIMRQAGLVVATALKTVSEAVRPGITTAELDEIAHQIIRDAGATPSFLGYHGYPAAICASINEEVVHGIPGPRRLLDGDIISIDCGAIVDGWHGDAAVSVFVGTPSAEVAELSRVTEASMWAGLAQARAGNHLSDIGHAVENVIRAQGDYGLVEEYVGHGIGTAMHMPPSVPNYGQPGQGPPLKVGMALAIEPMATLGSPEVEVLSDGWTVVTSDRLWASHWEHTVAITEEGPWVLTALDEVRL